MQPILPVIAAYHDCLGERFWLTAVVVLDDAGETPGGKEAGDGCPPGSRGVPGATNSLGCTESMAGYGQRRVQCQTSSIGVVPRSFEPQGPNLSGGIPERYKE